MLDNLRTSFTGWAVRLVLFLPLAALGAALSHAQEKDQSNPSEGAAPLSTGNPQGSEAQPGEIYGKMLDVPVSTLTPGDIGSNVKIKTPPADPAAIERGMKAFNGFNCVGCHMGNGGGGMGPALSNREFIYGSSPLNIYLTIVQGRPYGMPAWGSVLPDEIIWDLVAYVQSLSNEPDRPAWGTTIAQGSPAIQQVPAELQPTSTPWQYTEKFTNGQKP